MSLIPTLTPSDFVAIFNQTLEISFPVVVLNGEVSNLRVSKNKWVYFDIKDDDASLKCFATVYSLKLPLENGIMVTITAQPQLHPLYNLSLIISDVVPAGEGSIKKAADLLKAKLEKEGLFDLERKRILPCPPASIGLITSSESAAYGDFVKILQERWPLVEIILKDTKVQGTGTADEIVEAIHSFNQHSKADVLVIIRGGGSADDLVAFQQENMVRAVAESRIPTLVAIGHERDVSLVELVADVRASTPSNAAELLVPSKAEIKLLMRERLATLIDKLTLTIKSERGYLENKAEYFSRVVSAIIQNERLFIESKNNLLKALNPDEVLKKGYAVVRDKSGAVVRHAKLLKTGDDVTIQFADATKNARVIG